MVVVMVFEGMFDDGNRTSMMMMMMMAPATRLFTF